MLKFVGMFVAAMMGIFIGDAAVKFSETRDISHESQSLRIVELETALNKERFKTRYLAQQVGIQTVKNEGRVCLPRLHL